MDETGIISVEKNCLVRDDWFCVWPRGFTYHQAGTMLQPSEAPFCEVFFSGDF